MGPRFARTTNLKNTFRTQLKKATENGVCLRGKERKRTGKRAVEMPGTRGEPEHCKLQHRCGFEISKILLGIYLRVAVGGEQLVENVVVHGQQLAVAFVQLFGLLNPLGQFLPLLLQGFAATFGEE
jgi:hypothetical protein